MTWVVWRQYPDAGGDRRGAAGRVRAGAAGYVAADGGSVAHRAQRVQRQRLLCVAGRLAVARQPLRLRPDDPQRGRAGVVNKAGRVLAVPAVTVNSGGVPNVIAGVPVSALPASCKALMPGIGSISASRTETFGAGLHLSRVVACIQAAGFRQFVTYQPISRFWAFQSIETAIFLALAAALVAGAWVLAARRDA